LAGPTHRGRALGHIGLANYAGLAVGPPLAQLVGAGQPARVLVLAASLPLLAAALAATLRSRRDVSARAATDQGGQVTEHLNCGS
jgi:predicted MFS family arabinose efflux permease